MLVEYGVQPEPGDPERRHLRGRQPHPAEPGARRLRDGRGAHARVFPDLPAQHPVRPDRRQPQGLRSHGDPIESSRHGGPVSWWQSAAIYELYVQSFADGDGDGIGDLAGIRARLPYLAELGVDAIWFSPWYPSPMADAGYDVADYRSIDPAFGTLAEADALIAEAHAARASGRSSTWCPNHCSDRTRGSRRRWPAPPGSRRARPVLVPPRPRRAGDLPAQRLAVDLRRPGLDPDDRARTARRGSGTCTCSRPSSRTSTGPTPRSAPSSRTSCGSGSTAVSTASGSTPPPCWSRTRRCRRSGPGTRRPYTDLDDVHDIYRAWRTDRRRIPGPGADRRGVAARRRAVRPLPAPGRAAHRVQLPLPVLPLGRRRAARGASTARWPFHAPSARPPPGCCPTTTWTGTSPGTAGPTRSFSPATARDHSQPVDLALGTRRARAAALLSMALPGSVYLYQGEELGLWEVEDIPHELRQDPIWHRSGGADPGRDGCRVPLPWSGDRAAVRLLPAGAPARSPGCRSRSSGGI